MLDNVFEFLVLHCFYSHGQTNVGEITQNKDEFLTDVTLRVLEGFVYGEQCLQRPVIIATELNFLFLIEQLQFWPAIPIRRPKNLVQ